MSNIKFINSIKEKKPVSAILGTIHTDYQKLYEEYKELRKEVVDPLKAQISEVRGHYNVVPISLQKSSRYEEIKRILKERIQDLNLTTDEKFILLNRA